MWVLACHSQTASFLTEGVLCSFFLRPAGGPYIRGGMVKLKVVISFKRLQVIFIHSYGSSIAPKMTF